MLTSHDRDMLHVMPYCPDKSLTVQEQDRGNSHVHPGVKYSHYTATVNGDSDNLPGPLYADVRNSAVT